MAFYWLVLGLTRDWSVVTNVCVSFICWHLLMFSLRCYEHQGHGDQVGERPLHLVGHVWHGVGAGLHTDDQGAWIWHQEQLCYKYIFSGRD